MTNQTAWDLFDLARRMENIEDGCDNWNYLSSNLNKIDNLVYIIKSDHFN